MAELRSDMIKKGFDRAPHRSLLRAAGVKEEDFGKPFIAVCNSYIDIVPGHVHLQEFGKIVKEAIREAGGVPSNSTRLALTTVSPWAISVCAIPCQAAKLSRTLLKQ